MLSRLTNDAEVARFCLHGLNAVYLEPYGWVRLDPRGNKLGVDAQFDPPNELLAFPIVAEGEADVPYIYSKPLALITDCLENFETFDQVALSLPDLEVENFPKSDTSICCA